MRDKDQGEDIVEAAKEAQTCSVKDAGLTRAATYFPEDVRVAITTASEIRNAMRLLRAQRPEAFASGRFEDGQ